MPKHSSLLLTRNLSFTVLVGLIVVLLAAVLGVSAWVNKRTAVFTTTTSPQNTYSVNLKGAKGRPLLIPYWVSADVYKMGEPYVADVLLHEAWDAFDLSFELGFPETRWPANNIVEFYRPQYFEKGNDILIVQNRSAKRLNCLFIDAVSKYLIIDMRPGASLSLNIPKSRATWHWIGFEGVLEDGTKIQRAYKDFNRSGCAYLLSIVESGSALETRMTGC
jgi:hypothetical protein